MIIIFILSIQSIIASPANATKDDIKLLIHQMDKRFEQVDKRFESIQNQMDKRFEQVDKRFESMDKRFDVIMGYLLKERYLIKVEIQKELEPQLIRKADKNILDKVISIIEDMATKDKEIEELLKKHHLKLV